MTVFVIILIMIALAAWAWPDKKPTQETTHITIVKDSFNHFEVKERGNENGRIEETHSFWSR